MPRKKSPNSLKWISTCLRPDQKEYLDKKAAEKGVSRSELIREAIDKAKAPPMKVSSGE